MTTTRVPSRLLFVLTALSMAACADDTGSGEGSAGSTGPVSTGITLSNGNEDSTGDNDTTTDGGMVDTTVADDTTGSQLGCETILCGDPAVCCGGDEECVLGACVDACEFARCGDDLDVCCDEGDVCLMPQCVTPGDECVDSFDCPEAQFCEPTLGQCLPQQDPVACELIPDFDEVEVEVEWSIIGVDHGSDSTPDRCDPDVDNNCDIVGSLTMPLVGDVDGDGLPEVILNTWDAVDPNNGNADFYGHILVLDGQTGDVQFRVQENIDNGEYGSYGRSTPGIADVDDNGLPDIIYAGRPRTGIAPFPGNSSLVHAVNGLGQQLWRSHDPAGDDYYLYIRNGGVAFGNWDSDDASEMVFGTAVLDNDGTVVFDQEHPSGRGGAVYGSSGNYWGGISAIADLDGDGIDEIISGREAWSVDWQEAVVGPPTVTLTRLWPEGVTDLYNDGYPAVADLDQNGTPEVIVSGGGTMYILNGQTGELWCGVDFDGDDSDCSAVGGDPLRTQPIALGGDNLRGGPPIVADFDGDGRPEIGVAADDSYTVFDLAREDEEIVQPGGAPAAQDGEIFVRWQNTTQDGSASTGASVFDFQGDGIAEVVYGDECYLRVYSGDDGDVILEVPNSSATIHEYPVIADIDDDGHTELLVTSNGTTADDVCTDPGYVPRHGLFVYGDPSDRWLRTRQVWNSHTYHVTNSDSTGLYPADEEDNWSQPGLNNYRQNVQGVGVFNAPDLTVQLSVGTSNCLEEEFEVIATVRNEGSIGIQPGMVVALFYGTDASGEEISSQMTPDVLLPGDEVSLSWLVPAPGGIPLDFFVFVDNEDGAPDDGALLECNEDNQTSSATSVSCNIPG
ncbi:MAG: hypothetical protein JKY37_13680 [Nannocystaceae bacterium]|nr:hypothetical protein [Nannocystaceae bacterium]